MCRFFVRLMLVALVLMIGASAFTTSPSLIVQRRRRPTSSWTALSSTKVSNDEVPGATAAANNNDVLATSTSAKAKRQVAVLVCPAQFCVPEDYDCLFELLDKHIADDIALASCRVADLPRTEWIKVARQLPTKAFFDAALPVEKTLSWYFDAIEKALADILAENGENVNICIIGHSIGGWVARAYLGGLSRSSTAVHRLALTRVSSLVTLGTPHQSPETALVDQTRGLLSAIAAEPACSPQALADSNGIEITCVCSSGVGGKFLTTNIEELVAASSYLPLTGKFDLTGVQGDGIVPLDLAFLDDPARRVILNDCSISKAPIRHCHVVPTPWNLINGYAPSIRLPKESYPSYVTEGVVHQWAKYIR